MKVYLTEYIGSDGEKYGDQCYGDGWDDAQANADILGLGTVIGRLVISVDTKDMGLEGK